RPITAIENFALGGDATHITGSAPQGKTLRHLLRSVITDHPADLIHAHATGTELNDSIELAAIESCATGQPNIYSHKGALGHSLGAAGLVSVVLNCLSHQSGLIPPNVQTHRPMQTIGVQIVRETIQRPIKRSIAIAAGFGGAMGMISLRSI
ncbi:MAG TPA: hypothetical protein VKK61_01710, partial [Tepidisphaeraceae bacterium]|nr:hypothetical protein [Tepidisphaeraceae bacterium]